jgi:hypothetical protein
MSLTLAKTVPDKVCPSGCSFPYYIGLPFFLIKLGTLLELTSYLLFQVEIHELLALVYYDSLQNVVPFYDQRATLPVKDSTWDMFCQNSLKHFEKAFELK